MDLLRKGRDNQEVLNDPKVSEEHKQKIRLVQDYKKYFYEFFEKDTQGIYSETTFLEDEAVTYLVIASPFNKVEAKKNCFPFMGCFPYLGFFSKKSAKEHAQSLEKGDWVTYTRPVYAYSTLGYFEDNILSSFFYYKEQELAELIFHELFHTIFFVKDEVDLNEALASYFAREMVFNYFDLSEPEVEAKKLQKRNQAALSAYFVSLIREYKEKLEKRAPATKELASEWTQSHWKESMVPLLRKECQKLNLKGCYPLKREWNQASFAAFLTYEDKEDSLKKLHDWTEKDLLGFYSYIQAVLDKYEEEDPEESFSTVLFQPILESK